MQLCWSTILRTTRNFAARDAGGGQNAGTSCRGASGFARDAVGEWRILAHDPEIKQGIKLEFFDARDQLRGFVLAGAYALPNAAR